MSSDSHHPPYVSFPPGAALPPDEGDPSAEWLEESSEDPLRLPADETAAEGDLGDTLFRLRDELADVLPAGLVVAEGAELLLHGEAALIDLLLIQLVLAVRDMAAPGQLELQVAKEDPRWARITVRGNQPGAIGTEELEVLCQLAAELDGTVEQVRGGLSIRLPTGAAPARVIAVGCSDRRVVDTLGAEIARCGGRMVELARGEAPPQEAELVLADDERLSELPPGAWRSVTLVSRRQTPPSAPPGSAQPRAVASAPPRSGTTLGVPLIVGELEAFLRGR